MEVASNLGSNSLSGIAVVADAASSLVGVLFMSQALVKLPKLCDVILSK